jgi:hypothetical protein
MLRSLTGIVECDRRGDERGHARLDHDAHADHKPLDNFLGARAAREHGGAASPRRTAFVELFDLVALFGVFARDFAAIDREVEGVEREHSGREAGRGDGEGTPLQCGREHLLGDGGEEGAARKTERGREEERARLPPEGDGAAGHRGERGASGGQQHGEQAVRHRTVSMNGRGSARVRAVGSGRRGWDGPPLPAV